MRGAGDEHGSEQAGAQMAAAGGVVRDEQLGEGSPYHLHTGAPPVYGYVVQEPWQREGL